MAKLTKEEVKAPDKFIQLTDNLIAALERHRKAVFGTIVLGFLAVGGLTLSSYFMNRSERIAQSELYEIEKQDTEIAKKISEDKTAKPSETGEGLDKYTEVIAKYEKFITAGKSDKSTAMAAIDLSHLYRKHAQFEKAETVLKKLSAQTKKGDVFFDAMLMELANVQIELQKFDESIKTSESIVADLAAKYFHPQALLNIGLCYSKQGNIDKAKEYYQKVETNYDKTDAAQTAKSYLRLLFVQGKNS